MITRGLSGHPLEDFQVIGTVQNNAGQPLLQALFTALHRRIQQLLPLTASGQLLTDSGNHTAKVGQRLTVSLIKPVKTHQFGRIKQVLFSLTKAMNNGAKQFLFFLVVLFTAPQFPLPFPGIIQHQLFGQSLGSQQHSCRIIRGTLYVVFSFLVKGHRLKLCRILPRLLHIRTKLRLL